jgi:hypothetical protein
MSFGRVGKVLSVLPAVFQLSSGPGVVVVLAELLNDVHQIIVQLDTAMITSKIINHRLAI